jgi:glycosyltransferase involved in cell wall biosynthesis
MGEKKYTQAMKSVGFVIPVMNERDNIAPIHAAITSEMSSFFYSFEILFVCDPSTDGTEKEIRKLEKKYKNVKGIFLADRAGQAESIRAGLERVKTNAVITMDADFQDPPEVIPQMLNAWSDGSLLINSKRIDRKMDHFIYRIVTKIGYQGLNFLTKGRVQKDVGDFRLIDSKLLPLILSFGDPNPFWRGIVNFSGIKSSELTFVRPSRSSGKTKYHNLFGSPSVALRGMASFTNKPLELLQSLGIFSLFFSISIMLVIFCLKIVSFEFPNGIPTLVILISLFFSIQFFSTSIIATYLIILVEQTRRRPNYLLLPDVKINGKISQGNDQSKKLTGDA